MSYCQVCTAEAILVGCNVLTMPDCLIADDVSQQATVDTSMMEVGSRY